MRILTGNDLPTGAVIWWTGGGWSLHVADAADVSGGGAAIIAREEAARRVNGAYELEAAETPTGPRPAHIKDRIRAGGPTVHPAFAIHPELSIVKAAS